MRGRFSTPHSSETPGPIFMKLEIYNYFKDTTPHAKYQGPTSSWVVCANSQFDACKYLSFFSLLRHAHRWHLWTHTTPNTSLYVDSKKKVCILGDRKMIFEIWPPLPPKNVKIGTFSWPSTENCNRHNSGTVSQIHLELGTGIENSSDTTLRDYKVKRSKVKVTRAQNVYR